MRLDLRDLQHMPEVYSQEHVSDPIVHEHVYVPGTQYNAYLTEYSDRAPDGYPHLGFGYVTNGSGLGFDELGYVSLDELLEIRGPYGIGAQRDETWQPKPLSEVKRELYQPMERNQPTLDISDDGGIGL